MFSLLDLLPSSSSTEPASFLDTLAADLYLRAAGLPVESPVALRIVDDPQVAREVLQRHDGFVKNYDFLTDFARGRLSSAGGADWAARARLTRAWFQPASTVLPEAEIGAIYARHLDAALPAGGDALFDVFVQAGIEVFSRLLGSSEALAWSPAVGARIRALLSMRQVVGWTGASPGQLRALQQQLADQRDAIAAAWGAAAESAAFLEALERAGAPSLAGFGAAEELIMAVMASSETTASVLMWCVDCLAGRPELADRLLADTAARSRFVAEVLRAFPPVPLLTRRSTAEQTVSGESFAAGEFVAVSIVGLHCHPAWWAAPLSFMPDRSEWTRGPVPPAYMPFSRGERGCAGIKVARLEVEAGLAQVLEHGFVERGATRTTLQYGLSLRPSTSLRVTRRA